jgi:hypothetical protein
MLTHAGAEGQHAGGEALALSSSEDPANLLMAFYTSATLEEAASIGAKPAKPAKPAKSAKPAKPAKCKEQGQGGGGHALGEGGGGSSRRGKPRGKYKTKSSVCPETVETVENGAFSAVCWRKLTYAAVC